MKGNLLIVDDEPILLSNLEYLLQNSADKVFVAANGAEALELFTKNDIHCILCDVSMPVMDGMEFLREVRKVDTTVPFIFYTGHGSEILMNEAKTLGIFGFLNKPLMERLFEIVKEGLMKGLELFKSRV